MCGVIHLVRVQFGFKITFWKVPSFLYSHNYDKTSLVWEWVVCASIASFVWALRADLRGVMGKGILKANATTQPSILYIFLLVTMEVCCGMRSPQQTLPDFSAKRPLIIVGSSQPSLMCFRFCFCDVILFWKIWSNVLLREVRKVSSAVYAQHMFEDAFF